MFAYPFAELGVQGFRVCFRMSVWNTHILKDGLFDISWWKVYFYWSVWLINLGILVVLCILYCYLNHSQYAKKFFLYKWQSSLINSFSKYLGSHYCVSQLLFPFFKQKNQELSALSESSTPSGWHTPACNGLHNLWPGWWPCVWQLWVRFSIRGAREKHLNSFCQASQEKLQAKYLLITYCRPVGIQT